MRSRISGFHRVINIIFIFDQNTFDWLFVKKLKYFYFFTDDFPKFSEVFANRCTVII